MIIHETDGNIHYVEGDICRSSADLLVCPVNCLGTMGKGLARQFKDWFPELDKEYQKALRNGSLHINTVAIVFANGRAICLFPTKWDWREPSRMAWIINGLEALRDALLVGETVAIPRLGCGLGGLDFERQVKPVIAYYMKDHKGDVFVYV